MNAVRFGRAVSCDLATSERREWLLANGIGGYACGTVAGLLTRRYHGLLVASLAPPVKRVLLVPKIDESIEYLGATYALGANRWVDGAVDPSGFLNIESFALEGSLPVWRFACADAIVEKRIWMVHGLNATCVRYRVERASANVALSLKVFVDARDHHGSSRVQFGRFRSESIEDGIRVADAGGGPLLRIGGAGFTWTADDTWYYGFDLARERERGLDASDDHWCAARGSVVIEPRGTVTIVLLATISPDSNFVARVEAESDRERGLLETFHARARTITPAWIDQLALAADQFIVRRGDGSSVIAGYPWFADWGRDAMISLPGLALATGRPEIACSVLLEFAQAAEDGLIPNRFSDDDGPAEYNTADATLWFFVTLASYLDATGDESLVVQLFPKLAEMIARHVSGTRFHIQRDPNDGLLYCGEPGVQLTWMDAKVGDRVITPRTGKPVEINALWHAALRSMARFAVLAGKPAEEYERLAGAAHGGFARFWNSDKSYCFDVIDGPEGDDDRLRPNQIVAAALPDAPLSQAQRRAIVDACAKALLTSRGLRSLAPTERGYIGVYAGDPSRRDEAYHQGTVWGWLLGQFALAHYRAYGDAARALTFLEPMQDAMEEYCAGTLAEIYDGDAPHAPRGCFAQVWSVAQTLNAWLELKSV